MLFFQRGMNILNPDLSLEIAESLTKEQLSSDKKQTELVQKLLKEVDFNA